MFSVCGFKKVTASYKFEWENLYSTWLSKIP